MLRLLSVLVAIAVLPNQGYTRSFKHPEATLWIEPLSNMFLAIPPNHILNSNSPTIHNLNSVFWGDAPRNIDFRNNLEGLTLNLHSLGLTPQTFDRLPYIQQIEKLKEAAKNEEDKVKQIVTYTAQDIVSIRQAINASQMLQQADDYPLHMSASDRHSITQARIKLDQFINQWRSQMRAFLPDLPAGLANGDINPENIFVLNNSGWQAADEGPVRIDDHLLELLYRRLDELDQAPNGPWLAPAAEILSRAIQGDVATTITTSGSKPSSFLNSLTRHTDSRNIPATDLMKLSPAINAFKDNQQIQAPVSVGDIRRIERYYEQLFEGNTSITIRAHMLNWLKSDESEKFGFPSFSRLSKVRMQKLQELWRSMVLGQIVPAGAIAATVFFAPSYAVADFVKEIILAMTLLVLFMSLTRLSWNLLRLTRGHKLAKKIWKKAIDWELRRFNK